MLRSRQSFTTEYFGLTLRHPRVKVCVPIRIYKLFSLPRELSIKAAQQALRTIRVPEKASRQ